MDKSLIAVVKETLETLHRHSNLDGKIDPLQKKIEVLIMHVTFVFNKTTSTTLFLAPSIYLFDDRDKSPESSVFSLCQWNIFLKELFP